MSDHSQEGTPEEDPGVPFPSADDYSSFAEVYKGIMAFYAFSISGCTMDQALSAVEAQWRSMAKERVSARRTAEMMLMVANEAMLKNGEED